jgi:hypothetical protein
MEAGSPSWRLQSGGREKYEYALMSIIDTLAPGNDFG